MSLYYAIVDYPLSRSIELDKDVLQTNESLTTISNDKTKCIVSFPEEYSFVHKNYAVFSSSQALLSFQIANPLNWDEDHAKPESEYDDAGRLIVRQATTDKGWTYRAHSIEFTTAKPGSVWAKTRKKEEAFSNTILKFYDDNLDEVDEGFATRTVLTLDPGYDYDLISGMVSHPITTDQDVRLFTEIGIVDQNGLPFDPDGPGTAWSEQVVEFVTGINLKSLSAKTAIETDGRSGKKLFRIVNEAIPFNQNQIQITVDHPAGLEHEIHIILQYYRKP